MPARILSLLREGIGKAEPPPCHIAPCVDQRVGDVLRILFLPRVGRVDRAGAGIDHGPAVGGGTQRVAIVGGGAEAIVPHPHPHASIGHAHGGGGQGDLGAKAAAGIILRRIGIDRRGTAGEPVRHGLISAKINPAQYVGSVDMGGRSARAARPAHEDPGAAARRGGMAVEIGVARRHHAKAVENRAPAADRHRARILRRHAAQPQIGPRLRGGGSARPAIRNGQIVYAADPSAADPRIIADDGGRMKRRPAATDRPAPAPHPRPAACPRRPSSRRPRPARPA